MVGGTIVLVIWVSLAWSISMDTSSVPVFEVNGSENDSKLETNASCLIVVIFLSVVEFFETLNAGVGAIFVEFVEIEEIGGEARVEELLQAQSENYFSSYMRVV